MNQALHSRISAMEILNRKTFFRPQLETNHFSKPLVLIRPTSGLLHVWLPPRLLTLENLCPLPICSLAYFLNWQNLVLISGEPSFLPNILLFWHWGLTPITQGNSTASRALAIQPCVLELHSFIRFIWYFSLCLPSVFLSRSVLVATCIRVSFESWVIVLCVTPHFHRSLIWAVQGHLSHLHHLVLVS